MKQGYIEGYIICFYRSIIFYINTTEIRQSFRSETDWLSWVKNLMVYQRIIL